MSIVSLDLETTGLDERIHEAWEVALVTEDGRTVCWHFPMRKRFLDMDNVALQIGHFDERYACEGRMAFRTMGKGSVETAPNHAVRELHDLTDGATLLGCAIQFDMRFLTDLYRGWGFEPNWHHRALDLGSYAAGCLGLPEPLSSARMAECVPNPEAHTAVGDARWNWKVYRRYQRFANG